MQLTDVTIVVDFKVVIYNQCWPQDEIANTETKDALSRFYKHVTMDVICLTKTVASLNYSFLHYIDFLI